MWAVSWAMRLARPVVDDAHQIEPRRIPVGVPLQILAKPIAKAARADNQLELPHDDRRLLVNDRSVHLAGFVEVAQLLPDRVRPGRAVHLICRGIVR